MSTPTTSYKHTPDEQLLTVQKVADLFEVKPGTIRAWLKSGDLQGVKLSNSRWRIPMAEVRRFAKERYGPNGR